MEDHQTYGHYSFCKTCRRTENRTKITTVSSSSRMLMFTMALSLCICQVSSAETLCGGELVDALQFVCEDRGFYFSRPNRSNSRRTQRGIVEECCFRSCDLPLLEQYCAKPAKSERDVSATIFQVIPVLQPLHKDIPRKPLTAKYSKYDLWERKAAQRLRRGIPAILRARKFKRQVEIIQAQEEADFHRPLMTLPGKRPSVLSRVKIHTSRK